MRYLRFSIVMSLLLFLCLVLAVPSLPAAENSDSNSHEVKIGILANRGVEKCLHKWQPIIEYLNENFYDKNFKILPLGFDEVEAAVAADRVDFIFVNPAIYITLEEKYKVWQDFSAANLAGYFFIWVVEGIATALILSVVTALLRSKRPH